jgi:hypothetical protein
VSVIIRLLPPCKFVAYVAWYVAEPVSTKHNLS